MARRLQTRAGQEAGAWRVDQRAGALLYLLTELLGAVKHSLLTHAGKRGRTMLAAHEGFKGYLKTVTPACDTEHFFQINLLSGLKCIPDLSCLLHFCSLRQVYNTSINVHVNKTCSAFIIILLLPFDCRSRH